MFVLNSPFLTAVVNKLTVIVIYSVLFMEWSKEGEEHPFEEVSALCSDLLPRS
jgi:hypothetical protein